MPSDEPRAREPKNVEMDAEPYVNGLQEWVGESEAARWVLYAFYGVSGTVAAIQMWRDSYGVVLAVAVVIFVLTSLVHFWKDVLAPEMRHPRGEYDAK